MPRIGPWELILILAIVLIVFGVGKLPQIGGAIGRGLREFRKGTHGDLNEKETTKPQSKSTKTTHSTK